MRTQSFHLESSSGGIVDWRLQSSKSACPSGHRIKVILKYMSQISLESSIHSDGYFVFFYSNVWVVSTECQRKACKAVHAFNASESSSFRWSGDASDHLSVSFGTGSLTGRYGRDTIRVGGIQEEDFPFAVVTDQNGGDSDLDDLFELIKFEGIVGFGRKSLLAPGLRSLHSSYQRTSILLPRDSSFADSSPANKTAGRIVLNADPHELDEETDEEGWLVLKAKGEEYWELPLESVFYGDQRLCCDDGVEASFVIDTGSSGNTLPTSVFDHFTQLTPAYLPCPKDDTLPLKDLEPLVYHLVSGSTRLSECNDTFAAWRP